VHYLGLLCIRRSDLLDATSDLLDAISYCYQAATVGADGSTRAGRGKSHGKGGHAPKAVTREAPLWIRQPIRFATATNATVGAAGLANSGLSPPLLAVRVALSPSQSPLQIVLLAAEATR
jgi:hypothetical protein